MTDQAPLTSNPLAKRISMVECAGGKSKPRLEITFATIEDMHAASDFIRAAHEPETALDDHSELLKKLPNVHPDLVAELEKLSKWALVRRVLIQADWLGSYSKCLDGLDLRVGVDGCWNPRDIRAAVEKLRAAEPPSASREQQLLTELAYWKARCGVMHGDETNAVTKSVTVPVLPTSEEDERIVDAAIKRRLSGETEAPLTFETFFAKVRETGWNPSPRELATLLYEYEKEHCICSEFQGVNLRCPIHGTAESEEGSHVDQ